MKRILLTTALLLTLASPAAFAETPAHTVPVQFPDQRFPGAPLPGQVPGQAIDPFTDVEREQMMQETLMTLRDIVNVMMETPSATASQKERLDDLSSRLDLLIRRQQDLAMRQRMGR